MKCSGCNQCTQSKTVRVNLSPSQSAYLANARLVDLFNELVCEPAGRKKAKLSSRSIDFGLVAHFKLFVAIIPAQDLERIEVRGLLNSMMEALKTKVFCFPLTRRDKDRMSEILSHLALKNLRHG